MSAARAGGVRLTPHQLEVLSLAARGAVLEFVANRGVWAILRERPLVVRRATVSRLVEHGWLTWQGATGAPLLNAVVTDAGRDAHRVLAA